MTKTFIWIGIIVGSTIGGAIPMLWGDGVFSAASILLSMVGSLAGVVVGYKVGQSMG